MVRGLGTKLICGVQKTKCVDVIDFPDVDVMKSSNKEPNLKSGYSLSNQGTRLTKKER